jgi:nucleoside-diphosphate-sugar epimerase
MAQHTQPILVTGGSGFIASWVVKYLLAEGYHVRATVRDKRRPEKVEHLMQAAMDEPGVLELVEADLLEEGSFLAGMQGCKWVIHLASPFLIGQVDQPQQQLINPALQGTRNVLNSVNQTPSVERVVLTSSVAAVAGDNREVEQTEGQILTEAHWNQTSNLDRQPYAYSKTLAEKAAWKMAQAQDRWQLLTINPGFVLGPALSQRKDAASFTFIHDLIGGQFKTGAAKLTFGLVDVRDVARAHILACEQPDASGRHIVVSDHQTMLGMSRIIRRVAPTHAGKLPRFNAPKFLMYAIAPFLGFSWQFVRDNVGIPVRYDNQYSQQDLGLIYRDIDSTFHDMIARMEALGQI